MTLSKDRKNHGNDINSYGIFEVINGTASEKPFILLGKELLITRKAYAISLVNQKLKKNYPEKKFEIKQLKEVFMAKKEK